MVQPVLPVASPRPESAIAGAARGQSGVTWRSLSAPARALALFLGAFCLLNELGELRSAGFNANLWWVDLRWLPGVVAGTLRVLAGLALTAYALRPRMRRWRRALTIVLLALFVAFASLNCVQFYVLLGGTIQSGFPLPFSALVAAALGVVTLAVLKGSAGRLSGRRAVLAGAVLGTCAVLFPLGQMLCFGKTQYSRPADAVVVFGARAYANGRPSDALADRVRTACGLYRQGLAHTLIFSGGPGDGDVDEPEAMRRFAVGLGVRGEDIILDRSGLNTRATVCNTRELLRRHGLRRVLAVSHFYHLPRVKMTYQRYGVEVYTVPAIERYPLTQMPYLIFREVAALWVYYLRPLIR